MKRPFRHSCLAGLLFILFATCLLLTASPVHAQTRWALLIGVDQYEDGAENSGRITRLVGAVADANELGKALVEKAGFPAANVVRLTTGSSGASNPSKNAILKELNRLKQRVQKGDTVFVFYAGHGCEDGDTGATYLMPYDAQAENSQLLRDTALPLDTFNNYLRKLPAGLLLLAFDMCRVEVGRAGDTSHTETLQSRGLNFSTAKAGNDDLPQVVVKWFACKPGQKSYESQVRKRGYFSWWLEQGLRGEAAAESGQVTLSSLLNYVSPKVRSEVDKIEGKAQVPNVSFDGANTLSDLSRFVLGTGGSLPPVVSVETLGGTFAEVNTQARLKVTCNVPNAVVSIAGSTLAGGLYSVNLLDEATTTVNVKVTAPNYEGKLIKVTLERGKLLSLPVTLNALPVATPESTPMLPPISLDLLDTPIRAVLHQLFSTYKIKYYVDPRVAGSVTLRITDQPFENALSLILRSATTPITYEKNNDVYHIKPLE